MLGNCTSAISARISGNARKRKDILDPLNWRYNHGKHKVLNYLYVVSTGPGRANQNQLAWEACMMDDDSLSDSTKGGMVVEVVESMWRMDSPSKTPRRTLELAGRIGKRPVCMLIDLAVIGNYLSAQECAMRNIKIEKEENGKELTMADGSKVRTIGRVWLNVRCGGYRGIVEARVFPHVETYDTGTAMAY